MTILEKIIALHSKYDHVKPGDIVDVSIDARVARDFGGANVVKNLKDNGLDVDDPAKTFFTFDCNPTGSDQKYAENQHICRMYAREKGIKIYDINGRLLNTLVSENLPAGNYLTKWAGNNASGGKVSSGVYIYSIRVGDRAVNKKMTLLK